jgi:hypothetical protein
MPVKMKKNKKGGYTVSTPNQVHAKNTTKAKAESQVRLLNAVEHGWKPDGIPKKSAKRVHHSPTMTQIDFSKIHTTTKTESIGKGDSTLY